MDWHGHSFAFKLRIDVEHVEAQRYTGDYRLTKVAVVNLLDLLAELDVFNEHFCKGGFCNFHGWGPHVPLFPPFNKVDFEISGCDFSQVNGGLVPYPCYLLFVWQSPGQCNH